MFPLWKVGHKEADCWVKHGKPTDKANTAEDRRSNNYDSDSDDDVVLISIAEIEDVDFAGISFTHPEDKDDKKEKKGKSIRQSVGRYQHQYEC